MACDTQYCKMHVQVCTHKSLFIVHGHAGHVYSARKCWNSNVILMVIPFNSHSTTIGLCPILFNVNCSFRFHSAEIFFSPVPFHGSLLFRSHSNLISQKLRKSHSVPQHLFASLPFQSHSDIIRISPIPSHRVFDTTC